MEEVPETVLIAVDTNRDTNLVVILTRDATIADVREKIQQGHMALYPSLGSINILAVKVELFNRLYLLEDSHRVGQIFRGWQGCLHVELADDPSNSPTASRLRLPLISAGGDKAQVSPNTGRKHLLPGAEESDDRRRKPIDTVPPIPVAPQISQPGRRIPETSFQRTVASLAVEDVGSQKSSDGRTSSERFFRTGSQGAVTHRHSVGDGQGIETVEAGLDMALDALLDVGPEMPANVCRSGNLATDVELDNVANKDTFGGTQASTQSTPRKPVGSEAQLSGDSMLSGKRKRRVGELLSLTASQDPPGNPAASLHLQKQVGGSVMPETITRGESGISHLKIDESLIKAIPDFADKTLSDKKNDVVALNELSSSESGPDSSARVEAERSPEKRAKAAPALLSGAKSLKGRVTYSTSPAKSSEKKVVLSGQGGEPQAKLGSGAVKFHSSNRSSGDRSGNSEAEASVKVKAPEPNPALKRSEEAQDKSGSESSGSGDSSKSYRPEGSAGTRDVDDVVNKLVNLYSPIISDDSGDEQSSDASEERQPKGLRSRINSDEADNDAKKENRRFPARLNKFQHFIDSQDGLDQLLGLTLSARKPKPPPEVEPEPQVPAARVLALDSLSIDIVPDTQVGISNFDAAAPKVVHTENGMPVQNTTGKGLNDGAVKPAQGGSPDMGSNGKEKKKSSKPKSKETTDTDDDPSDSLKNFANIASESARKLDSNEDLPPKSDDSQQFQAAVQLTRLGMVDEEDDAESDPMQSPDNTSMEKKKKKKKKTRVTPGTLVAASPEKYLPNNVENTAETDMARIGLATASNSRKEGKRLLAAEHRPQEIGVDKAGTSLGSPRNVLAVAEQSLYDSLEKNEEEVNSVIEAITTSARILQENVEQQVEKEKLTEVTLVPEDQNRSEFASPGKAVERKKLSARRVREEMSEHELNITGAGVRDIEPKDSRLENVPYVEDSPVHEGRTGGEGQDEVRTAEKSGRKKKVKKGTGPAEGQTEERSGVSLLKENAEGINRVSDKRHAHLRRLEPEEFGADYGRVEKNETRPMITPQSRKKKKLRADGESDAFVRGVVNADEAFARVVQMKNNPNLSSHRSNASGDLSRETLTSGPGGENFPLPGGSRRLADDETPVKPPVSKKKKVKRATGLEQALYVTDVGVDIGYELNQANSDVEAANPGSELGNSKPRKVRKKLSKPMEQLSTAADNASLLTRQELEAAQSKQSERYTVEKHSKELKRRKLLEEVEFADLDSKFGLRTTLKAAVVVEDASRKATTLNDGPPTESAKRKKKITPRGNDGDMLSTVLNMNRSPIREDRYRTNQGKVYASPFDDIPDEGKTGPLAKRKKKKLGMMSGGEEENDEALEPICNQLGYRSSGVSSLNRDVSRSFDLVDDIFRDDKSDDGHTKTKRKRAKSMTSKVEKTVSASSPKLQYRGSRTTKQGRKII